MNIELVVMMLLGGLAAGVGVGVVMMIVELVEFFCRGER